MWKSDIALINNIVSVKLDVVIVSPPIDRFHCHAKKINQKLSNAKS